GCKTPRFGLLDIRSALGTGLLSLGPGGHRSRRVDKTGCGTHERGTGQIVKPPLHTALAILPLPSRGRRRPAEGKTCDFPNENGTPAATRTRDHLLRRQRRRCASTVFTGLL